MNIFECAVGLHAFIPADALDPAGTACTCGAVSLIGVVAVVQAGGQKRFLAYLIDTNESDDTTTENGR